MDGKIVTVTVPPDRDPMGAVKIWIVISELETYV